MQEERFDHDEAQQWQHHADFRLQARALMMMNQLLPHGGIGDGDSSVNNGHEEVDEDEDEYEGFHHVERPAHEGEAAAVAEAAEANVLGVDIRGQEARHDPRLPAPQEVEGQGQIGRQVEEGGVPHGPHEQPLHDVNNNNNNNNNNIDNNRNDIDRILTDILNENDMRMALSEQERGWALAIRAAIESSPEVDNLSDFHYAQYALVDQDNVQAAVDRAHHFQVFREEYDIRDTLEHNLQIIHTFVRKQPKFVLALSYNQDEGNYVLVLDIANFDKTQLVTVEDEKNLMGFAYNLCHVLCPDLYAIRRGQYTVVECEGYDFRKLSMKVRQKIYTEVLMVYPYIIRNYKFFHTGLYAILAKSLMKQFVPPEIYRRFEVGCQFAGRLDTFYAVPNREIANQRLLSRMEICLRIRQEHERQFNL